MTEEVTIINKQKQKEFQMYGKNLSSYQERLEIVLRLKLKIFRDLIFTNQYKNVKRTDVINLVSDLIEIRQKLEFVQLKIEYLR